MRILKFDDLFNIVQAINDAGYSDTDMTIELPVENHDILKKINEEFFYRSGIKEGEPDPEAEEVNVRFGNVGFKYVVAETPNLEV